MEFRLDEGQVELQRTVAHLFADRFPLDAVASREGAPVDRAAWAELAALGVPGLLLAEDAGGSGLGAVEAALVFEQVGSHVVPGPLLWAVLAAPLVDGVASGDRLVGGVVASEVGSAGAVTVEHAADLDVLLVVHDDRVVAHDLADVGRPERLEPLDPLTPVGTITGLGRGRAVGDAGDGLRTRLLGTVLTASALAGVAARALETARDHALDRHQFGVPIGSFQAVKHMLADMYVDTNLAQSSAYAAAAVLDDPAAGTGANGDGDGAARAAAAAKLLAAQAAIDGASTAIQVLGGMGFTWEMLPNYLLKRAWVLEQSFGAADDHALFLGSALQGLSAVSPAEERGMQRGTQYDTIEYEVGERTATITLNRPGKYNALSPHMIEELRAAYAAAESDEDVWTVVVTANGTAFCTGADVGEIPDDGRVIYPEPYLSTLPQWEAPQEGTPPFRTMTKPMIVAVNGLCCGAGLDWVTTCDIVIASERAEFFDPHTSIGLVSGREMVRLARVLPTNIAMRIALTGRHERMGAQRAYDLGMVSELVDHDRLRQRALEIAATVNRNAPLAVRGTRLAVRKGLDLPLHEAEIMAEAFRERVLRTDDAREGPAAFMEKRAPKWTAT